MADVFQWVMSAANHKGMVNALAHDIRQAMADQTDLPIKAVFDLLPLEAANADEIIGKGGGKFKISGNQFENVSDDEVVAELYDPVLKEHVVSLPATFGGTLDDTDGMLTITFQPALSLEIAELADLGVQRSAFQWIVSIALTDEVSLTTLHDQTSENFHTWIEAELVDDRTREMKISADVTDIATFKSRDACAGDPSDPNWYVYQKRGGLCFPRHGRIAVGGSLHYTLLAGPATKDVCDQYISINCENDFC
ncbi:hypothetical protein [uncultured Hoeflea sp.]|uniref:hypothetical protein n=1 Tax=uncultured Hoeflea sp. TaxID=538666 RepID=UPI0030D78D42|tara:strand:+ start:5928 stop:6683 length:756 start_codon:yes stop_codon:yes gene_type:complete